LDHYLIAKRNQILLFNLTSIIIMKKYVLLSFSALLLSTTSCDLLNPDEEGSIILVTENITTPTTWVSTKEYVIETGICVEANLNIEPGTKIKFKSGAWLSFGCSESITLTANGTQEEPIVFTAEASSPTAGAWQGIWFEGNTLSNSSMSYCRIEYAGHSNYPALNLDKKISFNHNVISNVKMKAIYSYEGFVSFEGNDIETTNDHAIEIPCDALHTLGQNNDISCSQGYGIMVNGGLMDDNTAVTWRKQSVPYYIEDGIFIEKSLTINTGAILKFKANAWLSFGSSNNATLNAVGTLEEPITFTSAATTPAPGAWAGLFFADNTTANTMLKHCIVEYGGKDNDRANVTITNVNGITLENCTIRHSSGYGIFIWESSWNNLNNTFSNNALSNVYVGS
jgi:parallel beta-helix repeat protein